MSRVSQKSSRRESGDEEGTIQVKRESSVDGQLAGDFGSTVSAATKDEDAVSQSASPLIAPGQVKTSRSSSASSTASKPRIPEIASAGGEAAKTEPKLEPNGRSSISPIKTEPPKPTKVSRSATKLPPRVAPLFDDLPDVTAEATASFTVITACTYQNKFLGFSDHALDCDCSEEWDNVTKQNLACGDDSDCINRACKIECANDCSCGTSCQNQRFLRQLYADVSVIKTEKKGYGLRANTDLKPHDFIFEYIGETIPEGTFRKRMIQYDKEGIKHFYFMSLSKGEFIDATKKGNLGRFCNHSCNPNCYVDKWVVGEKLRMGIFAERKIKAGEELVFNYNVDRYGANPQPCYCGESNCTGFIGGKTQTERATKLSAATIEALGIDDDFDAWDTMVARRPRKKKTEEDDEDYVDSIEAKSLDADGVTKVMAALMQCKEKWIAVKLFQRIQRCHDEVAWHRIVRLHGYQILNSQLSAWRDDENIILQILDVLDRMPRLTRNKIVDAKIEATMQPLTDHTDERVATQAAALLEAWSKLELAYRIPRKKREDGDTPVKVESTSFHRRESTQERKRSRSRSRSKSPPRGPALQVPAGPKSMQRSGNFPTRSVPTFARPPPLPRGWFAAHDNGRTYYYSANGETTWTKPTKPAEQPPPPPKQPSEQDVLKSIIENINTAKVRDTKTSTPDTPEAIVKPKKEERWKSYDEEKQKKLYENTLHPHITYVMSKYKHKIPKEDLKRFAKEISKKLVSSDYKAGRVKDPTKIDEKQQRKVKEFCKQFFDKAYQKHKRHEEERAARRAKRKAEGKPTAESPARSPPAAEEPSPDQDEDVKMSDNDNDVEAEVEVDGDENDMEAHPAGETPSEAHDDGAGTGHGTLKRKRISDDIASALTSAASPTASPSKKTNVDLDLHTQTQTPPPPPPPPPAPPAGDPSTPMSSSSHDEQRAAAHTNIHKDTNFKGRSMADVLAQAQQEGDEDEDQDARMDADTENEALPVVKAGS